MTSRPTRTGDRDEPDESDVSVRAEFDWSVVPPSTAVIEAVGEASGRKATTLGPLHDSFDTDALNSLLRSNSAALSETDNVSVSFVFEGYLVQASSTGDVAVYR